MISVSRSRNSFRSRRRTFAVGSSRAIAGLAAVVIGITLAPPDANALTVASAQATSRQVVQEARSNAAQARKPGLLKAEDDAPAVEPLARTQLTANQEATLAATDIGVTADFSAYEVKGNLDVQMTPASETAAASAASETEGQAIGDAVEITASAPDGTEVTDFPAEVETVQDEHGVESAVNVIPGITLGFDVDPAAVEKSGLDPATLKIFTREAEGDPWLELPSYFDAETEKVIGESDHLSQFVVIGKKFVPPPGPRIVLDPDDDYGWAETPGAASELPYNVALSNMAAAKLSQACLAPVLVTRQADVRFVSGQTRAAIAAAFNPVITVTVAFDALVGSAWGTESDGGTYLYSRGGSGDQLAASLINTMPSYTGRPAGSRGANAIFPDPAFSGVPGAMAHMETLYLDHNYDRAVIDNGFEHVVNGAVVGIARYAESLGFNCTDPVRGGLPGPPSKAELERWRHLGHQNYQTYGADPVSFSTGNLVEDEELFTLSGRGDQELDFTLTYNSQDGRLSRIGAGWSFGLGGRAQRFDDGSALVVRGDGASFAFAGDGAGGYTGEDGLGLTLRDAGAGTLELRAYTGEIWKYDAADIEGIGELISTTDRQGNTTRLTYGAASEDVHQFVPLASVTDAAGQSVRVENDGVGRVTAFVHPDGRRWQLAYDGAGNLASITNPDGSVRAFSYDDKHQLITATDALGVTYLKNEYDSAGRMVKQWDAEGNLRTFEYGDGVTKYTDAEGQIATFSWDQGKRITRVQDAAGGDTKFSYDDANRVTKATDSDEGVTKYSYDEHGNVTTEVRPDGGEWKCTWTPAGELVSETDPLGRTTTHEIDERGLKTRTTQADGSVLDYSYTTAGDLSSITHPSGAVETFAYDSRGNLVEHVTSAGRSTVFEYDAANRLVKETNGLGSTVTYAYNVFDQIAAQTDSLGRTTSYTYDSNGQLLTATAPDGGVTRYEWDSLVRVAKVTDPEGGVTSYAYNKEDALIGETDPVGGTAKYEVDPLGRITQVTDPLGGEWGSDLDAAGRITRQTDSLDRVSETVYDQLGQVTSETDPEGGVWKYTYDAMGNQTAVVDPEGGETTYTYDDLDRLVEVVDPDGRATSYEYDADDHLIVVIDPVGETVGYKVDADGLTLEATDALNRTTHFEFDAAAQLIAQTDPLGGRAEYSYDAAGQLVLTRDPLGGETRYEYDAAGRQTAVVDPAGNRAETHYDKAGRITALVDGVGAVTSNAYDKAGRQISTTDPEGRVTRYSYDAGGQLVKVVEGDEETTATTKYVYTAAGELSTIVDPLGGEARYEYDKAGRLVKRTDAAGARSSTSYDKLGRTIAESNGAGQSREFKYSKGGLLAEVNDPTGKSSYEYDGAGRLIVMTDPTGVTAWAYDKAGQVLSETSATNRTTKSSYDAAGRVSRMTLPDGKRIDYSYDALGQMTEQQTPWGDVGYQWRADGVLAEISRGNGVRTSITSDADDRAVEILHAAPQTVPKTPEPETEATYPSRTPASCPVDGTAGYLDKRTLPNLEGEDGLCVKTAAYLNRRALPAPTGPVAEGGALRYSYTYTPAGHTASAERDLLGAEPTLDEIAPGSGDEEEGISDAREVIESMTQHYSYDALGRLNASTATDTTPQKPEEGQGGSGPDGVKLLAETQFGYDAAGNRTLAETQTPDGTSRVEQQFGAGNRLTGRSVTGGTDPGVSTFSYDGAGRRTGESGGGLDAGYRYGYGNTPTEVRVGDRTTNTQYDGLGRIASQDIATRFGADAVSQSYLLGAQTERSSSQHGVTATVWGALGEVAGIANDTSDEARWALLDRLSSVVAEATGPEGADISQLASYSEYGVPEFESTGYAQFAGFGGETQDGGTGSVAYASRSYDAAGGTWMAPDAWPGLTTQPRTLNSYAFVLGAPTTYVDEGGFRAVAPKMQRPGSWAQAAAQRAIAVVQTATMAARAAQAIRSSAAAGGAGRWGVSRAAMIRTPALMSSWFMQARHLVAKRSCDANIFVARGCAAKNTPALEWGKLGRNAQSWANSSNGKDWSFGLSSLSILAAAGAGALRHPILISVGMVIGTVSGIGGAAIDCLAQPSSPACVIGSVGVATGPLGTVISRVPGVGITAAESVLWATRISGWNTDALLWIPSAAEWWERGQW